MRAFLNSATGSVPDCSADDMPAQGILILWHPLHIPQVGVLGPVVAEYPAD